MTYSRLVAVLCFVVIMLITALTPIGLPRHTSVDAGHDDPATSHLSDINMFPLAGGRIVRNIIEGNLIPVCSDAFPISTKAAIASWKTHVFTKDVFAFEPDVLFLPVTGEWCRKKQPSPRLGVGSVLVVKDSSSKCMNASCIDRIHPAPDDLWDTYVGQLVISVGDYDTGGTDREVLPDGDLRVTRFHRA